MLVLTPPLATSRGGCWPWSSTSTGNSDTEIKLLSPRPRRDFDFFTSDMNETPFSIPHELVPRCSLFHVERVFDKLLNEQPSCKVYPLLRIVSKLCLIVIKHRQRP